ncbi:hypothetical protein SKAU_G00175660 [Synaphobranchus kaupii]|uniref:Uncharacterized protein n=1 Tax=Synaphobranchus kaupii TaxID=118154 RepID=A0A9Q1FLD3_SYNKA|nr:hypothetical protein SKAU_G00175660 [Synaphobranchus kaupii]
MSNRKKVMEVTQLPTPWRKRAEYRPAMKRTQDTGPSCFSPGRYAWVHENSPLHLLALASESRPQSPTASCRISGRAPDPQPTDWENSPSNPARLANELELLGQAVSLKDASGAPGYNPAGLENPPLVAALQESSLSDRTCLASKLGPQGQAASSGDTSGALCHPTLAPATWESVPLTSKVLRFDSKESWQAYLAQFNFIAEMAGWS